MNESEKYLDDLLKAAIEKQNHIDEEPIVDQPIIEEVPVVEEAPLIEEVPVVEEAPVIEEVPIIEEIPVVEEAPIIEEVPVVEEVPAIEAPIIGETSAEDEMQDDEIAQLLKELDHIDQIDFEQQDSKEIVDEIKDGSLDELKPDSKSEMQEETQSETQSDLDDLLQTLGSMNLPDYEGGESSVDSGTSEILNQISDDEEMNEINELLKNSNSHDGEEDDILKMLQGTEQKSDDYVEDSIFAIEEPLAEEEPEEPKEKKKFSDLFKKREKKNKKSKKNEDQQLDGLQSEEMQSEDMQPGGGNEAGIQLTDTEELPVGIIDSQPGAENVSDDLSLLDAIAIEEEASAYKEKTETKAGKKSAVKAAKKAAKKAEREAAKQKDSEDGKSHIFKKIFDLFTEEVQEQEQSTEAVAQLFQETDGEQVDNLLALDSPDNSQIKEEAEPGEDEKKKKGKKGKKEKTQKEKKPKREKKLKKVREPEPPGKKLPRQHVVAIMTVCLSIGIFMFGISLFYPKYSDIKNAKLAYINGDYEQSYQSLRGHKLSQDEQLLYERSELLYRMERKYQSYLNFQKMGMNLEALNALVQGIEAEDTYADRAQELSVWQEYTRFSDLIGQALATKYQVTPDMAREWLAIENKQIYSRVLYDYINGTDTLNLVTPDGQLYEKDNQNGQDQIPDNPVISGEETEFDVPEENTTDQNGEPPEAIESIPSETIQSVPTESL